MIEVNKSVCVERNIFSSSLICKKHLVGKSKKIKNHYSHCQRKRKKIIASFFLNIKMLDYYCLVLEQIAYSLTPLKKA